MRLRMLLAAAVLLLPASASADEGEALRQRLDAVAPSIAVVKCVLHMKWSQEGVPGDQESPMDGRAAVVDPSGILVVRGTTVGADTQEQRTWRKENPGGQMKLTAEDIRVILPPDAKEHPAAVLLMDARLELAFLQVLDLGTTRLPAIDLTQSAVPRLGQTLAGVSRDKEGYGHAAGVWTLYASGRLEKPAAMWLAAGDFDVAGLPVFTLDGKACGILSEQSAVEGAGDEDEAARTVILPLETVLKSLDAARKKVPEVVARVEAERKAAAAATEAGKEPEKEAAKEPEAVPPPKEPVEPAKPGAAEPPKPPGQPR
jgi:hypothetical protein